MADPRDALRRRAEQDGIEFFLAMFVDLHGKPCAKAVPIEAYDQLVDGGAGFAGYAAGDLGQSPADPDISAVPDLSSYTPLPWKPGLAVLHCDPYVEGEPWPYAPRVILRRLLDELAQERGWTLKTGIELEYSLLRRAADGSLEFADPHDTSHKPCYEVKGLTRMWDHLRAVSRNLNDLGWGNYANDHEDGTGQFENNWHYADALRTADRAIFFRYMTHMLAHDAGMIATFMPKPFRDVTGNGLHLHQSLWDADDQPLFADDGGGAGLSELGRHYLAGLLAHGRSSAALICPTVNSYKRIGVATTSSGASWAPAYVAHGGNNRTLLLRVPEGGRIEHRGVDGSANPYLATVALLAAGLDGIDRRLDPGPATDDNLFALSPEEVRSRGIAQLPKTLERAVEELVEDDVLRAALGKTRGGDFIDYFARIKQDEFDEYHSVVSDWEINRYLTQA
ncbi:MULTISPECIES: type III glutamate--ammonia ligase [Pseudonocardia]|uniref:Glutamine synthetase 3 n=2 Tax=Pseudonocardia TaxID=1847 RepID=A0A1Y2MR78_PSEAH|nr:MULTISPECIES: type III glutamate--ammonia ligase [Pseudonocardia]OSY37726.1 Glutamine synthetase 3 [Pseudonocardia autotrophica]TDN75784.1 gamma-glutamylmethylamide synthetase [Pseudonocardia autotrophica]BBF99755.1 glutamine synthetase [Pseudonocardia autotrophica]GEC27103.1 glutamine synthetase [Pseudonocardia saturnea]